MGVFTEHKLGVPDAFPPEKQIELKQYEFTSPGYLEGDSFTINSAGYREFIFAVKILTLEGSDPVVTIQLLNTPRIFDEELIDPFILYEADFSKTGTGMPGVGEIYFPSLKIYVGFDTNKTTRVVFNGILYLRGGA